MPLIDIENPSKRFEEHLEVDSNYRVIFSGKFGTGKTYFLNKFFDSQSDKYNKFIVSPTNYVVSANEDIFELIKADIIKDMFLTGKVNLQKLPEDNTLQKLSSFVEENQLILGKFMLSMLSKLSSATPIPKEVIDYISSIYSKYKEHIKSKGEDGKTREELVSNYWFETNQKIGGIYEHNYITKLINSILDELRNGGEKKNVLIIDDLDRIDPDHIFRILNILSAHNNQFDSENKFLFDHIIIVCDIDNIKLIYKHRYGNEVDFEGYIDKFYSVEYFKFHNSDAVSFYVESALDQKEYSSGLKQLATIILKEMVESGFITVRQLFKHKFNESLPDIILTSQKGLKTKNVDFYERAKFLTNMQNLHVLSSDAEIFRFFKLMTFIFGDFHLFAEALQKMNSSTYSLDYHKWLDMLTFLALQKHILCSEGDSLYFTVYRQQMDNTSVALRYPTVSAFGRKYKFSLQWDTIHPYDSSSSYFKGAKCSDESIHDIQVYNGVSQLQVPMNEVVSIVNEIIKVSIRKRYLLQLYITPNLT